MNPGLKRLPAHFYRSDSGHEPVRDWLKSLDEEDRKTIGEDIKDLMANRHATGPLGWTRIVGSEEQS